MMAPNPTIVIPEGTWLRQRLHAMATEQRLVFFAGLPGVGKSLFLQQLALMADSVGRTVHLLQWDVTRSAFETPELLAQYPEVDGVTHAAIRKGVGLWARQAVQRWHDAHPDPADLLIGEVPLVGNRLIELVQPMADAVEPLLAGQEAIFAIPTPSRAVRQVIESARALSMANPQHEKERADAPSHVLQALWHDLYALAQQLDIVPLHIAGQSMPYDPAIYAGVYRHLLQHRQVEVLAVEEVLPKVTSVYDLGIPVHELRAAPDEVAAIMGQIQSTLTDAELAAQVEQWYNV